MRGDSYDRDRPRLEPSKLIDELASDLGPNFYLRVFLTVLRYLFGNALRSYFESNGE